MSQGGYFFHISKKQYLDDIAEKNFSLNFSKLVSHISSQKISNYDTIIEKIIHQYDTYSDINYYKHNHNLVDYQYNLFDVYDDHKDDYLLNRELYIKFGCFYR